MTKGTRWLRHAGLAVASMGLLALCWSALRPPTPRNLPAARLPALQDRPSLGSSEAPVHLVLFVDFQCPHCRDFEREVLPELMRAFLATGKARLTFVHAPFLGRNSRSAALAAECAYRQGNQAFWRYQSLVFELQGSPFQDWASQRRLLALAARVPDLDAGAFATCLAARGGQVAVEHDRRLALAWGVRAVPTVLVAGRSVRPDLASLRRAVYQALRGP